MQSSPNPDPRSSISILRSLLSFLAPFWPWIVLSVLLGFATISSGIGLMATSAWIIASAALHPSIAALQVAIVGVRFFGITRGLFRYAERLVSHQVTFRVLARLRTRFYAALEPLAPAGLLSRRSGDLLSRIVADIGTLEHFYIRAVAPPFVALLIAGLMWVFFASFDRRLALALLLFQALTGVAAPVLTRLLSRGPGARLVAVRAGLNATLVDGIQGLADLLAYGQAASQAARVAALGGDLAHEQSRLAAVTGLSAALSNLSTGLATLAVLALAIPLVTAGKLTGVHLAVLVLAAAASFEAVQPLPLAAQHLESSLAAARRLFEVVEGGWQMADGRWQMADGRRESPPNDRRSVAIAVKDLSFRYAAGEPLALTGVSFTVLAGGRVAIVGPSGAGKSTLVNLLLRFWDYQAGQIRLGGQPLRELAPEDVRATIGVVTQTTHLFNATVRDNLALARPAATADEIEAAARQAQIHDFIAALPQGYDTWIGEQGLRLSGGERQRLAIARALLRDAAILILDEATANLDALTERTVWEAIETLMRGRTTLIITHRLAGLEDVDEILVLDQGQVVERGRHIDLLQAGGLYRRMWDLQHGMLV